MAFKRLKYNWKELNRRDKTDIMTVAIMRQILMRGNNSRIGIREVNVNIGKNKSNLRIDVLEINRQKNVLVGYEIKSCIEDFRADKKWEKYLNLINQLYFVFDINTYEQYTAEILKRIGDKAGIYVFNPLIEAIYLIMGVTYKELPGKDETFYRTILFNYLFRKALREINGGNTGMTTQEHQITVREAINNIEIQQMTDEELIAYEKAIKEIKKKRGIGGRYGGEEKYNSGRDDYMTPPDIYEPILRLFDKDKFDIDVCCTQKNIPANIYYTKSENGLLQKWSGLCFCNPPWNKTPYWIKKGFQESINPDTHICYIIPSNRFETTYMQDYITNNPNAVWLILPQKRGFIIPGQENVPPIPSVGVAIAIISKDAKILQEKINNENIFKTTAFIGNP